MRRGRCVKCGSETVRAARNGIAVSGAVTGLRPHRDPGFVGMIQPHRGEAWQYACTTCGYLEWHILDPGSLAFIEREWGWVHPRPE